MFNKLVFEYGDLAFVLDVHLGNGDNGIGGLGDVIVS
jgi:hypothetical protein